MPCFLADWPDCIFGMIPPAIQLRTTSDGVIAELWLAGAKPGDLEVFFDGSTLTVEGFLPSAKMGCGNGSHYCCQRDRRREKFVASVQIPAPILEDEASAFCFSGILRITLPRPPAQRSQKLRRRVLKKHGELRR